MKLLGYPSIVYVSNADDAAKSVLGPNVFENHRLTKYQLKRKKRLCEVLINYALNHID